MSINFHHLDRLDRKILRALDRDSRQSFNALERTLRIPAETIRYRVRNLIDKGVITFFVGIVDMGKLGASVHKVLLKLHNVAEDDVQRIITRLVSNRAVNWVARMDGVYDIAFTLWVLQVRDLSDFVDQLKVEFHRSLSRLAFAVNIRTEFFVRDRLTGSKRSKERSVYSEAPGKLFKVDQTDIAVLREVALDTRSSATEIATKVGITAETVKARLRRLEYGEVLTGTRLALNSSLIGEVNYYLFIFLNYVSDERMRKFVDYCRNHPAVVYLIKSLGEWDFEVSVEVADTNEFREFTMELTRLFSDIVRDYHALPVNSVHKFTMMPEGVEQLLEKQLHHSV